MMTRGETQHQHEEESENKTDKKNLELSFLRTNAIDTTLLRSSPVTLLAFVPFRRLKSTRSAGPVMRRLFVFVLVAELRVFVVKESMGSYLCEMYWIAFDGSRP